MTNPGSGGKRRNRRNSSGERRKRSESGSSVMSDSSVKSGGSNSSGTEGDDGGMNNSHGGSCLSLDDFDFAEKEHIETENKLAVEEHPTEADTGPEFLAAFFRTKSSDKNPSSEALSHNSIAPKKFGKKSQKERKR